MSTENVTVRRSQTSVGSLVLGGYVLLASLFLLVPLLIVVPMSFSDQSFLGFPPSGWSLRWYEAVRSQPRWTSALGNSIEIGIPAALLATVIGTSAALAVSRTAAAWSKPFSIMVLAPMMLPHIILAIGLYPTIVSLGLAGTYFAVVIGHTVIGIPFVFITVSAALGGYSRNLEAAARTLGADAWRAFLRVTFPMTWPGIASGALLAFATSFDELVLALFLTGVRTETLPRLIWDQMSFALTPAIAAVATLVLLVTILLLGAGALIDARRQRRKNTP